MKWPSDLACGTIRARKRLNISAVFVSHCRRQGKRAVELLQIRKEKSCRTFLLGDMAAPFEECKTGDVLLITRTPKGPVRVVKENDLKEGFA